MYLKVDLNEEQLEKVSDKMARIRVMGKKVFLIRVTAKKGAIVPPHAHRVEQLTVVLSGVLKMMVGGKAIVLTKNNVLVTPEGVIHKGEVLEDAEYLDFWPEVTELFTFEKPT